MLKIASDNGRVRLHIKGTFEDIFVDTVTALAAMYDAIREDDPEGAEELGRVLKLALEDDVITPFAERLENTLIEDDLVDFVNDALSKEK